MPWRFIGGLIILIFLVVFICLNLENKTNISFGFFSFNNVPAFLIVVVSFLIGALVALPISVFTNMTKKIKSKKQIKKQLKQESEKEIDKGKKNKHK